MSVRVIITNRYALFTMSIVNLEPSGLVQLCPGSNITFVCSPSHSTIITWHNYVQGHPDRNSLIVTAGFDVDLEFDSGSFTILVKSTSPFVSTATLRKAFNSQQNETILVCSIALNFVPTPSEMENATLTLKGISYYNDMKWFTGRCM